MYYIGVDLGTSSVKLILMEPTGDIVNTVSKTYPISFPKPGWSEQNPTDWYDKTCEGIKELIKDIDKDKVAGISFGGQMHGLVILDENDNVIRPAILWNDGRTTKECDYLNNEIGKDKLTEYTANIAFAGFTAPKLLWVKNNEPDNFKKIAKIMLPKDYIAYRLTGVHCTDVSDASGMLLLDVKKRDWSEEMINICKISRKQLPALYESYEKVGCITKEAAMELGLPDNVCVAAGAGDNAAAAVGTGVWVYNKVKNYEPKVVTDFRASLRVYIDAIREGSMDIDKIDKLMAALEELKKHKDYEKISIQLTTEELEVLVGRIYEYTIKLAEDNNVELAVDALNTAEMKNSGTIINLQNYLKAQKRIFEAAA